MPTKKSNIAKAVAEGMPGWRVIKTRPASSDADTKKFSAKVDFVSPDLTRQRAKIAKGMKPAAVKKTRASAKTKDHAAFVTVAPVGMPDTVRKFQKVVLVKGGKIIAQQG